MKNHIRRGEPLRLVIEPLQGLDKLLVQEVIGLLDPVVGFPLGDEDAVGGGYFLLLD